MDRPFVVLSPKFIRFFAISGISLFGLILACHAHSKVEDKNTFKRQVAKVKVIPPEERPALSQESVDLALVMFGIEVPYDTQHPRFDAELADRGLTSRAGFTSKAEVTVGPAAFSSWALLGSTLAHEIEVHSRQSFFFIHLLDLIGLDGTLEAERQAYIHELRNAKRFGLGSSDTDLIADTMEYYYPLDGNHNRVSNSVRRWLARTLLR